MSEHTIKLPDVGEGITEAEIVEWHVSVGDAVVEDELLGAVMTDKAAVDIPSPVAGVVVALGGEVGDVLAVGADYVTLAVDGAVVHAETSAAPSTPAEPSEPPAAATTPAAALVPPPAGSSGDDAVRGASGREGSDDTVPNTVTRPRKRAQTLASPAVRRRAHEHGVELRYVQGSGPAGRVSHADLDAYLAGQQGPAGSADMAALPQADRVEEIRVVGMRRQIAEKMQTAKQRIPHFSYVEETDVTTLEELRAQLNSTRKEEQPKLTLLPFMVLALVRSLAEFPQMNARYDDEAGVIRRHRSVHLGIAVQTDRGLMVPVLRDAQALDVWQVAERIGELAEQCRSGRIRRDDLTGATLTLTSLGALGGIVTTPVINYPEVAIVGINRIVTRPVFVEERVVPRKLMNLSSSFDHRVVDGFEAAEFIQRLRSYIEFPSTIFIS